MPALPVVGLHTPIGLLGSARSSDVPVAAAVAAAPLSMGTDTVALSDASMTSVGTGRARAVHLPGASTQTTSSPTPPTAQKPFPQVPIEVEKGVKRFEKGFLTTPKEPTELHGLVYEQYEDGRVNVLKHAWETTPSIPSNGPDIPSDAVSNNRVFIYVDGIHQTLDDQQDQIHRLYQAPRDNPKHGASIDQPAIGIHEAAGPGAGIDGTRIALDLSWLKALQGGYLPQSWIEKAAFRTDAAVRSVHHEVRQSLEAGRDVQIALHSGGGAETALALNLLSKEDGGRWKNAISEHVRILALAPAAAFEDFEVAGVKADNIYYTASKEDPVYRLAHKFVKPWQMLLLMARSAAVGIDLLFHRESIPFHSPDYIFWRNVQPDGQQPIQTYLDGGQGGEHILS